MGISTETTEFVSQPAPGLSLRRNFAWTVAGNVVYAACQWGVLVVLSKLGSPTLVGQFALGLAIGAPVLMLTNLQLRAVQATDARGQYQFGDYLGLRLVTTSLAFVGICAIAFLSGYRWQSVLVVILVGAMKSVESVSDVIYGLLQKHERLDRVAIALMLRGLGSVLAFALALWATGSVAWAVGAMAGWWTVVLLTYERGAGAALLTGGGRSSDVLRPAWNWPTLGSLAWLSVPLGVVMMLASLNTNIPRYFVEHYLGEAALGYFAALAYVVVAGQTVMTALGQSASPRLARHYLADRRQFWRLLTKILLLALGLGVAGVGLSIFAGRLVLTLLYRADYAELQGVFTWLMVAAGAMYVGSMLGYAITATRRFHAFVTPYTVGAMATLIASWLLVPRWGVMGAGWAVCVSALFFCLAPVVILSGFSRGRHAPR